MPETDRPEGESPRGFVVTMTHPQFGQRKFTFRSLGGLRCVVEMYQKQGFTLQETLALEQHESAVPVAPPGETVKSGDEIAPGVFAISAPLAGEIVRVELPPLGAEPDADEPIRVDAPGGGEYTGGG